MVSNKPFNTQAPQITLKSLKKTKIDAFEVQTPPNLSNKLLNFKAPIQALQRSQTIQVSTLYIKHTFKQKQKNKATLTTTKYY
jgi:hypothetical protein